MVQRRERSFKRNFAVGTFLFLFVFGWINIYRLEKYKTRLLCENIINFTQAYLTSEVQQLLIKRPVHVARSCITKLQYRRNQVLIIFYAPLNCNYCKYTLKELRLYCKIQGYKIQYFHSSSKFKSLNSHWEQIFILKKLLSRNMEFTVFVWINADVLIINLYQNLDLLLNLLKYFDLIISHDKTLDDALSFMKAGIFVVKNSFAMEVLFKTAAKLANGLSFYKTNAFHEKPLLTSEVVDFLEEKTILVPANLMETRCFSCIMEFFKNPSEYAKHPLAINFAEAKSYKKYKLIYEFSKILAQKRRSIYKSGSVSLHNSNRNR